VYKEPEVYDLKRLQSEIHRIETASVDPSAVPDEQQRRRLLAEEEVSWV